MAPKQWNSAPDMVIDPSKRYTATMSTSMGDLVIALDAVQAPNTVNNFVFLAREGYYDGVIFHRIIPGFMIQGGDPTGTGGGGPGYELPAEFNETKHVRGILSMARTADPNSAGSQFFICLNYENTRALDKKYTVFGKVTEGLDVIFQLAKGDKMEKVTISDGAAA